MGNQGNIQEFYHKACTKPDEIKCIPSELKVLCTKTIGQATISIILGDLNSTIPNKTLYNAQINPSDLPLIRRFTNMIQKQQLYKSMNKKQQQLNKEISQKQKLKSAGYSILNYQPQMQQLTLLNLVNIGSTTIIQLLLEQVFLQNFMKLSLKELQLEQELNYIDLIGSFCIPKQINALILMRALLNSINQGYFQNSFNIIGNHLMNLNIYVYELAKISEEYKQPQQIEANNQNFIKYVSHNEQSEICTHIGKRKH
ncbi:hypothetical protein pb186bvf_013463 [Paramecium bursaria]